MVRMSEMFATTSRKARFSLGIFSDFDSRLLRYVGSSARDHRYAAWQVSGTGQGSIEGLPN